MPVPSDPPANVGPAALHEFLLDVADTAQDHETRIDTLEGEPGAVPDFWSPGGISDTIPRWAIDGTLTPTSGRLQLARVTLLAGQVVTSISWLAANIAGASMTNQWFGLFDANRAALRLTADDGATAWAAQAVKTLNLTSTYVVPTSGKYYIGLMVAGATPPNLRAKTGVVTQASGLAPILGGTSDTGLTTPPALPFTAAAITAQSALPYGYVS